MCPVFTAGVDYINETITFTWLPTETQRCYPFRPINDTIVEGNEQLRLILVTSEPRVTVNPLVSIITIQDNDSE